MIKIIMILDQIQAGLGTKDDKMLQLGGSKEAIGPAVTMSKMLKEIDAKVIACLYCGNGTYMENKDDVTKKLTDKIEKLNPDIVICGPAYNFLEYANMCAKVSNEINKRTNIKAFCAMSLENEDTINEYKDSVIISKMPKKGGVGLNDAFKNICNIVKELSNNESTESIKQKYGY